MTLRFGSVCSGIEAASVAWGMLGWQAAWFSEIEPFPSAVLRHHYPGVVNWTDMRLLRPMIAAGLVETPDVLCGGTPCQAFSMAGLRESLDDERGNLTLEFVRIADAIDARRERPCTIVWENVHGVLNTRDNAFGCFLAGLCGEDGPLLPPGKWWADAGVVSGPQRTVAWRTIDAQFFGVAQRRRRVFVVASALPGFDPASVLFEWQGSRRDSPPRRGSPQGAARGFQGGTAFGGNRTSGPIDVAPALLAQPGSGYKVDFESETFVVTPEGVRRLMPEECERLQGFPVGYTAIPWRGKAAADCPDGPRYRALGNSWAVPCVAWLGARLYDHLCRLNSRIDGAVNSAHT